MSRNPIKLAHHRPWREFLAGLSLVLVFWLIMQIEGVLYLQGVHSYQGALIHVFALVTALVVADKVGYISYLAIALIVLIGITGMLTADFLMFTNQTGGEFNFGPWYAYVFPSVFACMTMYWIRRVKLFIVERKGATDSE